MRSVKVLTKIELHGCVCVINAFSTSSCLSASGFFHQNTPVHLKLIVCHQGSMKLARG